MSSQPYSGVVSLVDAPTLMISGVEMTEDQLASISAAGGKVLWHGYAGNPHGDRRALQELPGLADVVGEAEVWFGPGLSDEILPHATQVRWLQTNSAGVEGFLSPGLVKSPVVISNVRGMHSFTTGDHALALMLTLARDIAGSVRSQSAGEWNPTPIEAVFSLSGSELLVLGTGRIGQAIAKRAAGFEMTVRGVSRTGAPAPGFQSVHPVSQLTEVAGRADWFVVAAPATAESRHIVSRDVLAAFKRTAILVNIARGSLVDEAALAEALSSGQLRAAGLDVFETEPLPANSPLWRLPNVVLTPHAGGAMQNYGDRAVEYLVDNLRRYRSGEDLVSLVNKHAGY